MTLVSAGVLQGAFESGDTPASADFKNLLDSFEHSISAAATSDKVDRLGAGAVGKTVFAAGTTASAQNVMGAAALGRELFGTATTASAQAHLGGGAVGIKMLETGTTASAQSNLGGGAVGRLIYEASTTASAASITGGANAATTAQAATPAVSASAVFMSPDNMRYSPYGVRAFVTFSCAAAVLVSKRVSSVAKRGVGDFVITFAPALPTADYVVAGLPYALAAGANETGMYVDASAQPTVSAVGVRTENLATGAAADPNNAACIAIFCSGV